MPYFVGKNITFFKKATGVAHDHNIAVHYYTVNDKDEMRYLIELGVDGIMTDYPMRLKEVLDEYRTEN